ncbi:helix-turn-helix domain-containing protein [Streptomyces sp. NPDC056468]|uniref:helix-turn-helix domain-containing protein n=1 Tax=Streptomyces sp. NPDC056468 TaxID=3345830 RepID=UPI0036B21149
MAERSEPDGGGTTATPSPHSAMAICEVTDRVQGAGEQGFPGSRQVGATASWARRDLTRYTRQRAECIRLLDRGKTAPDVADLLECNVVTVRTAAHRLHDGGVKALTDAPLPGRPARALGDDDRAALARLLDVSAAEGITWTVPALHDGLREQRGVEISADWLWELLRRDASAGNAPATRCGTRPTRPPACGPRPAGGLANLRMEAHAGERDLIFLDESGFVPTMPTGYTYSRIGQRTVAPREDTKNPRVNVLGAQIVGATPDLLWQPTCGKIDAGMLMEFVCADLAGLPGGGRSLKSAADGLDGQLPVWALSRPCTAVLDNASANQSR